ncbi:Phospholipase A2 like protein [Argiope bruennichi]|uniref:Phospholipase A2 n=1 Tax=Argiope bruennichi TaxID=94029 RepID=A0A8T0EXH4_ARGBR|nr:Phospholipase A2 like protein [Argiope bruennichi]
MLGLLFFCLYAAWANGDGLDLEHGSNPARVWAFYVEDESGRMVSVLTNPLKNTLIDCYVSGDRSLIIAVMQTVPKPNVTLVDKKTMDQLVGICSYAKKNGHFTRGGEVGKIRISSIIYPGTKWCGAGNISEGYDDLGEEVEADKCCRDHDYCDDNIPGYESKHGLDNNSPFTKSHCDCDDKFYNCLMEADTKTSHRVGKIFFNYIQMECFRQDNPVTGCKRYKGWIRRRCQEYEYDRSSEPIWQFFDAKHYSVEDSDEDNEIEDDYKGDVFEYMLQMVLKDEKSTSFRNKMS